ncbi:MAG: hypothetical protein J6K52_00385 [Clostridia bacterium]|nr:hypothetical protein [Clostridia bacterium]MBO5092037.1 hypothetical protein [Clostridia bacterium]MBP3494647.1 hypothetical protein [Clostridia bacterium]
MAKAYKRISLGVESFFTPDGSLYPKKIVFGDQAFEITRVLRKRNYCPRSVPCIAPIEYTVIIDGKEKYIYFEADTNMWFSIKEVFSQPKSSLQKSQNI